MKKIVMGMLASAVATLFFVSATPACSSSKCSKACSNDPEPTAEQVKACEEGTAPGGKCQTEFTALSDCSEGKTVCTDNKTDAAKTSEAITKDCGTQLKAYTDCAAKP
jgi:hypothetical protein